MHMPDSKEFTIKVKNIPPEVYNRLWSVFKKRTMANFGIEIAQVNTILIDGDKLARNHLNEFAELFSSAITAHVIEIVESKLDE